MFYLNVLASFANFAFVFVLGNVHQEGSIVFRSNRNSSPRNLSPNAVKPISPSVIPLDMIRRMDLVTNEEEFIEKFVAQVPPIELSIQTRIVVEEPDTGSQKKPPTPMFARCQPELQTVKLRETKDPTLVYFPSCIRVDRCGGCCTHDSFRCQPTKVEYINVTTKVFQYVGNQTLKQLGEDSVPVEVHKKCQCDCRVKVRDCTTSEMYITDQCRCVECSKGKCPKS